MIEIRNLQFQPLTFDLPQQKTLYLAARERKSIAQKDLCAQLINSERHGLISLTYLQGEQERLETQNVETEKTIDGEDGEFIKTTPKRRR